MPTVDCSIIYLQLFFSGCDNEGKAKSVPIMLFGGGGDSNHLHVSSKYTPLAYYLQYCFLVLLDVATIASPTAGKTINIEIYEPAQPLS
jgi:hypothetical protein